MVIKMKRYLIIAFLFTILIYGCTQQPVQIQPQQANDGLTEPAQQNADENKPTIQPNVYADDQQIKEGMVLIKGIAATEPSWIVIHSDLNGNPGQVIGYVSVKSGETSDIRVRVDPEKATERLFAMLHSDKGEIGVYEFPGEDAPAIADGKVINVGFKAVKAAKQSEPVAKIVVTPTLKEFAISADEIRFRPSTITLNKGDKVKITFSFNDENIYYGGLDIKSDYFTVTYRKSDSQKTKTAEFTADKSFTFTSYWPSSGVKKAAGKVEVT